MAPAASVGFSQTSVLLVLADLEEY